MQPLCRVLVDPVGLKQELLSALSPVVIEWSHAD